ncbi:SUN domain-containing ossification factor-like [Anneissia japonica]|uniref:SUN domain-containing ossification factor-like n=1 Tax=Anneissia japonica TaxID=1529436 RepID=UPI0014257860|nr:SUN domain-containing ossification factor-like [Anneissia japonica]
MVNTIMAKKRLHRTTILLFVCIISSLLFSLSVCTDHARHKPTEANSHASGGQTQESQAKENILPTIHATSNGAKTVEHDEDEKDEDELVPNPVIFESFLPSQEKFDTTHEANNIDSISKQAINSTQDIKEDFERVQPGSVEKGISHTEEGVDNAAEQEVPSKPLDEIALPIITQIPDNLEVEEEEHKSEEHQKEKENIEDFIDDSTAQTEKNLEEFLGLDFEKEMKKEGIGKDKEEREGGEGVIEGRISKEYKPSASKGEHGENVQYDKDETNSNKKDKNIDIQNIDETKITVHGKHVEQGDKPEDKKDEVDVERVTVDVEKVANDEEIAEGTNGTAVEKHQKEDTTEKKEEEEVDKKEVDDPMLSFNEWKQQMLELNEQEKMQANYEGQPVPVPRHSTKLSNKNYASADCGAKIIDSNKESQRTASAILSNNKDEYMLNPCTAKIWFMVEMCEPIQVKKVEIANLELFSSTPESFRVFTSDRHPTAYWRDIGLFHARDERSTQTFPIHDETLFTKFIKVEFLTFFGKEHYCPISLLRVFGTSMEEEIDSESDHQIDASPPEVLPVHPTVTPEDTSADGIFDSVIKIVEKAAKAFRGESKDPGVGNAFNEACFGEARIPNEPESVQEDELIACFPHSNSVLGSHINALRNKHQMMQKKLMKSTEEKIKTIKTSTDKNPPQKESAANKTNQDSITTPTHSIPVWSIVCKSCQYSFRPHYADIFHECHLVALSIFEFGIYFCCHDASIRTRTYDGTITLRAPNISKCNSSSTTRKASANISKVIEASAASMSTTVKSVNVQSINVPSEESVDIHLESTPSVSVPSGTDATKETPPLPDIENIPFSGDSSDKMESDTQKNNIPLVEETDKEKPSNIIQNVEDKLLSKDVSSQTKPNDVIQEESFSKKEDPVNTETSSSGIQDSVIDTNKKVADSESDMHVNSLTVDKKDDQIKTETQQIKLDPVKEPASEPSRNDNISKPSDTAASDIKEHLLPDSTDSVPIKSSEPAPGSSTKPNDGNGQENGTNGKSKTIPGDGFSNQFGLGIQKESVLMRLNNRIKSLEVNLSLSTLYLQELSQRYKKQMDDMRRSYDTKVAKLYENAMMAEEKEQIQTEQVKILEDEIKQLKASLHNINMTLENAYKEVFEGHYILMLVEVVIVGFLLICTRTRQQVIQEVPTGLQGTSFIGQSKGHSRRNSYSGRIDHEGVVKSQMGAKLEGGCQDLLIIEPPTPIRQACLQPNENMKSRRLKNKQKQKNNIKSSSASNFKKDNKKVKTAVSKANSISIAGLLFGGTAGKESSEKKKDTCNGRLKRPRSSENLTRVEDIPHIGQDRLKYCNGY